MVIYIYALIDPRTEEVRYVGQSKYDPIGRYKKHITNFDDKNRYKVNWIKQLMSVGMLPRLITLEECSQEDWSFRERYWIKHYKNLGCNLVNLTDGGEGMLNPSIETRNRLSESHKRENLSCETREKMSSSRKGENNPMFGKSGINSPAYGRKLSAEHIIKIRLIHTGKFVSEETRMRMRGPKSESHKNKIRENHADFSGENNPFYHKNHSADTIQKLSEIITLMWKDDAYRNKMISNHADFSGENNPMFGRKHSEETRARMRKAWNRRKGIENE